MAIYLLKASKAGSNSIKVCFILISNTITRSYTSHHLCYILLVGIKWQLLPILSGRGSHRDIDTRRQGSEGSPQVSIHHRYQEILTPLLTLPLPKGLLPSP